MSCIFLFIPFMLCAVSFKDHNAPPLSPFHISGYAQGTTYHITYFADDSLVVKKQVDSVLDQIDSSLSIYKPYSLISRFNNAAAGIKMDEHLDKVVRRSLEIYTATEGISDITVFPLMSLWGFGPRPAAAIRPASSTPPPPTIPDSQTVRSVLACVGSAKIHIRDNWLLKDTPCVKIDVNGIAQGYSVDVVAGFLEKNGISNYIVEIGGELRVKGKKYPGGATMQIGIEAPAQNSFDEPVIERIVHLDHGAITTSGNYRKYYQVNGKKISHLMDPKTGYPFQNELISVTVYANDAITADGYDNALMGMGLKKAFAFLQHHPGLEAYFIYHRSGGEITDTATTGFYILI